MNDIIKAMYPEMYYTPFIPDNIARKVMQLTEKPVQLKLDLRI